MLAIDVKKMEELSGKMTRFHMDSEEVMYRMRRLILEMSDDAVLVSGQDGDEVLRDMEECSQKLSRVYQIGEALCGLLPVVRDTYTKGVEESE